MTTDTIARPQTLEDLIQLGREQLQHEREEKAREEQEKQLANRTAEAAQLALILEQLPEAVHPFVEILGPSYGWVSVAIKLPDCDAVYSTWSFEMLEGGAIRRDGFEVPTYSGEGRWINPSRTNSRGFDDLGTALAYAIEQGPTYTNAEAQIAARAEANQPKTDETRLSDRLQTALELGDEASLGTDARWRLTAVIAEALVSIAESQRAIAGLEQLQFGG